MKTTFKNIIAVIANTNPPRLPGEQPPYTEVFQRFIDNNLDDPNALLELLELFIEDEFLPIDKKQYDVLLNLAVKNHRGDLLEQVPHGLSRLLIEAVKDNAGFGKIRMEYLGKGAKVSMDITDEQGKSALHYVLEMKSPSQTVIEYFLDYAENVEAFKPLMRAFLAVPATEENKEAWDYLNRRFTVEYADTQEESIEELSDGVNTQPSSPIQNLSLFSPGKPVFEDSAPKRMKLT
jgi:hypothetical protein